MGIQISGIAAGVLLLCWLIFDLIRDFFFWFLSIDKEDEENDELEC